MHVNTLKIALALSFAASLSACKGCVVTRPMTSTIPPYGTAGSCDAAAGHVCGTYPVELSLTNPPRHGSYYFGSKDGGYTFQSADGGIPFSALPRCDAGEGPGSLTTGAVLTCQPWPSAAVTPPPAGYVEWLTADQGVTFGTSGGWTNTLLATWDASSTDFWSGGSVTCSSGLINRRPAVAGLVQGQCSYNSTILWTNMTAGGACWTLAAVYQYTGMATGQAGSPTLDLAHGGGLIFDGLGWAGITVGNSGPMYGYQATAAACQAYPGVGTCVQATSDAGTAPNPHYVVGNFCNNTLSVWLDGIAGPSISDNGGLVTVNRPQIGSNGSGFVGLWRTFVVYRSTPDIPTLNTWLKNYGGF